MSIPTTGGPVMQTIGAGMQMLRPGEHTKAHRHTGCASTGRQRQGFSIIDGKRFDWRERDIFCVPSWAWHEHANASGSEDACLFTFNDLPVMRALGLYREEASATTTAIRRWVHDLPRSSPRKRGPSVASSLLN